MVFRGRTRYVIADPALNELMCDIHSFSEMENEFLYLKSQQSIPTFQEVQSRKVLYSDERKCKRLFNIRELQRFEFKRTMKQKKGISFLEAKSEFDKNMQSIEKLRLDWIKYVKEKHSTTINKYLYLHDIIRTAWL